MRVVHVTATFPPYLGGAGTAAFHLARGLAHRGHHVEVVTAAAEGTPPDPGGVVVHRRRPAFAIGNAPLLPELARLRGFDVVHLHYPFIFGTELVLAGRLGRREGALVVSYHNRLIGEGSRRRLFRAYEELIPRALMAAAERVCVVSRAHAATVPYLAALSRRHPERVAVLPNGVDTERFRPGPDDAGIRAQAGIPADAVVAAFVATLDRAHFFKRLDLAIEALALAGDPRLHLLVVGGGEWLERFRGEANARGLGSRAHFLGPLGHDRLPGALRAADLLVLPSDLESFGIVLLEAMACGLPTVASDLPGVRAVVRESETGLLVPPGDAAALAAAMTRLAALPPEEREAMGARGRAECERSYSWPALVERLEAIYRESMAA